MTTEQKRQRLINMTRGREDVVLLFPLIYGLAALPSEVADAYNMDARGCYTMPCEPHAVQRICNAIEARERARRDFVTPQLEDAENSPKNGVKWQIILTTRHYEDDADEVEVQDAMKTRPCLVNYGGTLRAVNIDADSTEPAIILKDMQTT